MADVALASASPSASPPASEAHFPPESEDNAQLPSQELRGDSHQEDAPHAGVFPSIASTQSLGAASVASQTSQGLNVGASPFVLGHAHASSTSDDPSVRGRTNGKPDAEGVLSASATPFQASEVLDPVDHAQPSAASLSSSARPFNPRRFDESPPRQIPAHLARSPTKDPVPDNEPNTPADPDPSAQDSRTMHPDTPFPEQRTAGTEPMQTTASVLDALLSQQPTAVKEPILAPAILPGGSNTSSSSYDLELLQQMHVCTVGVLGFPEGMDHGAVITAAKELCSQHGIIQKASAYANNQNRPFALVKMAAAEPAATAVQVCLPLPFHAQAWHAARSPPAGDLDTAINRLLCPEEEDLPSLAMRSLRPCVQACCSAQPERFDRSYLCLPRCQQP